MREGGRDIHVVDEEVDPGVAGDAYRQAAVRANEGRGVLRNKFVRGLTAAVLDHQPVETEVRTNANIGDGRPR